MYTVETILTGEEAYDGTKVMEIVVRDMNGHAVHTDCCSQGTLSKALREIHEAFGIVG